MGDCPEIKETLVGTEYKRSDLQKLFKAYYTCKSVEDYVEYKPKKSPIDLYFGGGVSFTTMNIDGPSKYYSLSGSRMTTTNNPTGMVGVAFALPRKLSRMSIKADLSYWAFESTAYTSRYQAALDMWFDDEVYFNMAYLNANVLFEYKYQIQHFGIFANAGFSYGYALKNENKVKSFEINGSPYPPETDSNLDTDLDITKNSQQGILLGAGLTYKIVFLEYRYIYSNGMITNQGLGSEIGASNIMLGLRFKIR